MLFPYKYVPHKMERMQEFIDFIFHEVWCKAPIGLPFGLELFERQPDLREILSSFGFTANAPTNGRLFYKNIKAIYESFASLNSLQIDQFKRWYLANNDIEKVCANDPATHIVRYADIAVDHNDLAVQLSTFFQKLYSQLGLAALKSKIGRIDDHYQTFVSTNGEGICPFCGLSIIKDGKHGKRDAYDHYLPKWLYPFNSINFRNLAITCHDCNSHYKCCKDPAHNTAGERRKAFYPYTTDAHCINLTINLNSLNIGRLTPSDIQFVFGPDSTYEEIETWKEMYGIEMRYKEILCHKNVGNYWLVQAINEYKDKCSSDPAKFVADLVDKNRDFPYAGSNFLKIPFLDACQKFGIFD